MTEHDQYLPEQEIVFQGDPSLGDRFWIGLNELGTVRDVVNSVRMATVAIGLETRKDELRHEREIVQSALIGDGDPDTMRQCRAIDMGFMYGSLLTAGNQRAPEQVGLPSNFSEQLARARNNLDLNNLQDTYTYFMRLRDIEVAFTGSDVLAFCLAATQDHVGNIFSIDKTKDDVLDETERTVLQTNYYAGALAGALATTDKALPLPTIQIMRSQRNQVEQVSVRLEFEAGDNLEEAVDLQLRSKYAFRAVDLDGKDVVVVTPGGLQFAPNALSMPIYIHNLSETLTTCLLDAKHIDAVLIEQHDVARNTTKMSVLSGNAARAVIKPTQTAAGAYQGQDLGEIKAVVVGDMCVSAYDLGHPWAAGVDRLVRSVGGLDRGQVKYANELQLWSEHHVDQPVRLVGKLALAGGVATLWIGDVVQKILMPEHTIHWGENIAATVGATALLGGMKLLTWTMNRSRHTAATQFDHVLQEYVDEVFPLQKPQTSGNIAD